jgi:hypothetical protein
MPRSPAVRTPGVRHLGLFRWRTGRIPNPVLPEKKCGIGLKEATALLERAAKLQPNNAEVAANLARLRGYVQSYAVAGVSPASARPVGGPLPPAPPPLWGTYIPMGTTYLQGPASEPPGMPMTDSYYVSEACKRRASGSGSSARVDIECEPRR